VEEDGGDPLRIGGRWRRDVVTPQVFGRVINPNDPVNSVDFDQTTVKLGHHLENINDKP
jgi:hypothetical protein